MKNLILIALSVTLALALVVPVSHAGELAGVTLDDTMRVGDRTVTLSGMGIRTKKVFFDASYSFGKHDEAVSMYYNALGDPEIAMNSAAGSNLMFTVGLRF